MDELPEGFQEWFATINEGLPFGNQRADSLAGYKAGIAQGKKGERREGLLITAEWLSDHYGKIGMLLAGEIREAADELEGK